MRSYIEVENVSKRFGKKPILENISLSVEQGQTIGLVGANGSGKSVLFKILCGFEKPDSGSVSMRGKQLGKNGRDFPENVGVFINAPGFIGMYSGLQNLKFLADIQGKISETEIREAMGKVGLDPENKTKVSNYSLGMKQKLGLAQAIYGRTGYSGAGRTFQCTGLSHLPGCKIHYPNAKSRGKNNFPDIPPL